MEFSRELWLFFGLGRHWPVSLLLVLVAARLLWRREQPASGTRAIATALVAGLAMALAYGAGGSGFLWGGFAKWLRVLSLPVLYASMDLWGWLQELSHEMSRLAHRLGGRSDAGWPLGAVTSFAPKYALALLVAISLIPMLAPPAQRRLLPQRLRALAGNPWPTGYQAAATNILLLLLCLVPNLGLGALGALILRLHWPTRLWPATWLAAILSFAALLNLMMVRHLFALFPDADRPQCALAILGVAAAITTAFAAWLIAATLPPAPRSRRARVIYILLILLCLPGLMALPFWHAVLARP